MLVVGPNLSIDQTVAVAHLEVGTIHRVPSILRLAGGKGTNVARALRTLGEKPLLCGFTGGPTGKLLTAYLRAEGIAHRLVPTRGETRVCFSIADEATGAQTEFYEAGAPVSDEEIAALVATAEASLAGQGWLILTGSLPVGAPADLYARLIALARSRGMRTLLDARGAALAAGLAERPDVVKVNRGELAEYLERAPGTPGEVAEAAAAVADRLGGIAIITQGSEGAVAAGPEGRWRVSPPAVRARSPVGAGDSAAAGVVAGLARGLALPDAVRLGVATGTASALHLGAARFPRAEVDAIHAGCQVAPLAREQDAQGS
jgi:1-phosphofructokinase family hexose kinase